MQLSARRPRSGPRAELIAAEVTTRESLQAEADRWTPTLRSMGYGLDEADGEW